MASMSEIEVLLTTSLRIIVWLGDFDRAGPRSGATMDLERISDRGVLVLRFFTLSLFHCVALLLPSLHPERDPLDIRHLLVFGG